MSGISTFERKTFRVQAVQVTVQNMKNLEEWCGGKFKAPEAPGRRAYVDVPSGRGDNTTRAYIGDWITRLSDANNCRVYRDKTFREAFMEIQSRAQRQETILNILWDGTHSSMEDVANRIAHLFEGES